MATAFASRIAMERTCTPVSTSSRCSPATSASAPLAAVVRHARSFRGQYRNSLLTQAYQGNNCWDSRRGPSRRGTAWGPFMWGMNGPVTGATLEDLAREFGFAMNNINRGQQAAQQANRQGDALSNIWADVVNHASLPIDIEEQEGKYTLTADVPGLQKSDLKITVNQRERSLTLSGERHRPQADAESAVDGQKQKFKRRFERRMGKFQRTIPSLPENADLASVTARVEKGVVTVSINKMAEVQQPDDTVNIDIE